ncbi:MAG: hypothetical protein CBD88_00840 [Flavobacteriales bacterium TMED228]|nr:MAG: hypothetical protein CBD88_00840 [Flavobacteriales bacterium TMED228]|tara:strand:+ start:9845 stop:10066 length:222 start_codon:yes stop_codon:yes gene_type:complete
MGKVVSLYPGSTAGQPNVLFENAKDKFKKAMVIGYEDDGNLIGMATSDLKPEDILFMIKLFEHSLLTIPLEDV